MLLLSGLSILGEDERRRWSVYQLTPCQATQFSPSEFFLAVQRVKAWRVCVPVVLAARFQDKFLGQKTFTCDMKVQSIA